MLCVMYCCLVEVLCSGCGTGFAHGVFRNGVRERSNDDEEEEEGEGEVKNMVTQARL